MRFLANNNTKASGILRENRVHKNCTIARKKAMSKGKRGFAQQQTPKYNTATILAWKDNKVVFFDEPKSPEVKGERYCREKKESHGQSTILYQFIQ